MKINTSEMATLVCLFVFSIWTPSTRATTIIVGSGQACPNATFSQIQAAIDQASPGDSIQICSGVYTEQLLIAKSLNITADSGTFVAPSSFAQNATSLGSGAPLAVGILVSGADSVSISGLTVDAINNAIAQCSPRLEGIYFQKSSGKITNVVVRNARLGQASLNGCQSGTGILVESGNGGSSNVEIADCQIYGFQKNGITANEVGTTVFVHDDTVTGLGPTTGAAQNGIQIGFGAVGKIAHNVVANMVWSPCSDANTCQAVATNILIVQSDGVEVSDNTASTSQVGIFAIGNNQTISRNQVSNSFVFDGIRVEGNGSMVLNNTVATAGEALVFIEGNADDVIHNTLSDAPAGILKISGSSDERFKANSFVNVGSQIVDPPPASLVGIIAPER